MPSSTASLPLIALYGTFDVLNYGDLLFPHLVRHGLGPSLHECVAVSPTRATLPWADTVATRAVEEAPGLGAALHLIGGGNIIHARETPLAEYDDAAFGRRGAYASLWLGAALVAAQAGGRLAWNAPGVPAAIGDGPLGRLRDAVLAASDYVSLRDAASAGFLGAAQKISILPDTALDIARMWPAATLREHARRAFATRGAAMPDAWTVFHVNERYLDGDLPDQARRIEAIASATRSMPVLVALGPCHGDDALARRLAEHLRIDAVIVDRPAGLREVAAFIAHAAGYVGSSLHGLITALSFGRPAIAVARAQMVKFTGFLDQLGMADRLVASWRDAEAAARLLRPLAAEEIAAISRGQDLIGQHWARLRAMTTGGTAPHAAETRQRLVQWMADAPPGLRDWRAFSRALDLPPPGDAARADAARATDQATDQAAERPVVACNICGGATIRPGPVSLPDQVGGGAVCAECGATARHRAMRTVLDALRRRGPASQDCLRLGRNRVVAGGWFTAMEDIDIDAAQAGLGAAQADMVVCIDMLERAPDVASALRALFGATRAGGFLFLALRTVPGAENTLDWGFPRGDRDGEFRRFGADAEEAIRAALPEASIIVAEPIDPVTGIATRAWLIAHDPDDLARLTASGIPARHAAPVPA